MATQHAILDGRYQLVENVIRGDRSGGPALWLAEDRGSFVYAKIWPRIAAQDPELRAIWNHEVRSLLRLDGYPRATEYFAGVREAATSPDGYYLILDVGNRALLGPMLQYRRRHSWLHGLTTISARQKVWAGLKRIVIGLSILHAEGTLHRTLGPNSVFVDTDGAGDFRLSGFEWSLRLSSTGATARGGGGSRNRLRSPELDRIDAQFSFASDWFDFGLLATEVISGISVHGRGRKALERVRSEVKRHPNFSQRERQLILDLLEPHPNNRLRQGTAVLQAITDATSFQRQRTIGRQESALRIGVSLAQGTLLTTAIVEVSSRTIKAHEIDRQRAFIEDDLNGDVEVIHRSDCYVVHGRKLAYRVQPWALRNNEKTWDVGYCGLPDVSASRPNDVTHMTEGRPIRVMLAPDLRRHFSKLRTDSLPWNAAFPTVDQQEILDSEQKFAHDFFRVTNQLDAVLTAAQIWPVEVVNSDLSAGRVRVEVTPVIEPAREELAQHLDLSPPAYQMQAVFSKDEVQDHRAAEAEYVLQDEGVLGRGDRDSNVSWRFDSVADRPTGKLYVFTHEDASGYCPTGKAYLSPRDLSGSSAQLRRRHRAIEGLHNHATLLSAIADPGRTKRDTNEDPGGAPSINRLDDSKQAALKGIWRSQPIFTLQGPPGTGKTELIRALVGRLLEVDPAQQILITAHSHDAVDHIRNKLGDRFGTPDPLGPTVLVRLDDDGEYGAAATAFRMARDIAGSTLASKAPRNLRNRIRALANRDAQGSADVRGFQALVRQAANVVFATSNSGDLARLMEGDRRFDWSILEEAGKAHGFDLAMALQASHRLLLIGDQRQLPPFNVRQLDRLLADPARVLGALKVGIEFAPSFVDRSFVEASSGNPTEFVASCQRWRGMIKFFAALYAVCELTNDDGQIIAQRLIQQHRMHPIIAELVRVCFYPDGFETAPSARLRFQQEPDPFDIIDHGWMPPHKIVFVDVPYVQKVKGAEGERGGRYGGRRYTSPIEAETVIRALTQLRAIAGRDPDIQILSPYKAQVELIRDHVVEYQEIGGLSNLHGFRFKGGQGIGATVDEFQGNEADVIIVSLVRNNASPSGSGLGFLSEEPRVNVMLSRAKWKLIIIGSWDFFQSRVPSSEKNDQEHELGHISRIMNYLQTAVERGEAARVPFDRSFRGTEK
jgi:serine/threonine protein kinase